MNRFDADTALEPLGDARFRAEIPDHWRVARGPNGGLLAALATRAMLALAGDAAREPRSLTVHYLEVPASGPVELRGRVERTGRSSAAVSLRFVQDGRTVALALGALGVWAADAREFSEGLAMPDVAPPEALDALDPSLPGVPTFLANYDLRWAVDSGPPAPRAASGGWLRTAEPRPLDPVALAAYADALPPAVFPLLAGEDLPAAPTVDLTIHWRAPASALAQDGWALASMRTRRIAGGSFEEDGHLWSREGVLLAQSRQLALLR